MESIEYCESCGKFVEIFLDDPFPISTYCPECNCDMRGEEDEDDHSFRERLEDGFNSTEKEENE